MEAVLDRLPAQRLPPRLAELVAVRDLDLVRAGPLAGRAGACWPRCRRRSDRDRRARGRRARRGALVHHLVAQYTSDPGRPAPGPAPDPGRRPTWPACTTSRTPRRTCSPSPASCAGWTTCWPTRTARSTCWTGSAIRTARCPVRRCASRTRGWRWCWRTRSEPPDRVRVAPERTVPRDQAVVAGPAAPAAAARRPGAGPGRRRGRAGGRPARPAARLGAGRRRAAGVDADADPRLGRGAGRGARGRALRRACRRRPPSRSMTGWWSPASRCPGGRTGDTDHVDGSVGGARPRAGLAAGGVGPARRGGGGAGGPGRRRPPPRRGRHRADRPTASPILRTGSATRRARRRGLRSARSARVSGGRSRRRGSQQQAEQRRAARRPGRSTARPRGRPRRSRPRNGSSTRKPANHSAVPTRRSARCRPPAAAVSAGRSAASARPAAPARPGADGCVSGSSRPATSSGGGLAGSDTYARLAPVATTTSADERRPGPLLRDHRPRLHRAPGAARRADDLLHDGLHRGAEPADHRHRPADADGATCSASPRSPPSPRWSPA